MTTLQKRIEDATEKIEADTALLHQIVHGDENTLVATGSGEVKSAAKALKDIESTINQEADGILEKSTKQADRATKAASNAQSCANIANDAAVEASKAAEQAATCSNYKKTLLNLRLLNLF